MKCKCNCDCCEPTEWDEMVSVVLMERKCEICGDPSFGRLTCEECFYDKDGEPRLHGF